MENLTTTQAAAAGGIVGATLGFVLTAALVYYVLLIIAGWKIFEKAGEKGWKALIPIYNVYIMYKIVKMGKWFWITFFVTIIGSIITTLIGGSSEPDLNAIPTANATAIVLITIAEFVFAFVIQVMYCIRTSRVFGHGAGYAVGLFFLSSIFWLILGLGKSKYDKKVLKGWD